MLREVRSARLGACEVRKGAKGSAGLFYGHASVFGQRAAIGSPTWGFVESIAPQAFDRVLASSPDVRMLLNHDENFVLARTTAGTLRLGKDDIGLTSEADIAPTTAGRDLVISLERGDISQMSFAFTVEADSWRDLDGRDPAYPGYVEEREILEVGTLYDVSPVTYPAYEGSDAGLRSMMAIRKLERGGRLNGDELAAFRSLLITILQDDGGDPNTHKQPKDPIKNSDLPGAGDVNPDDPPGNYLGDGTDWPAQLPRSAVMEKLRDLRATLDSVITTVQWSDNDRITADDVRRFLKAGAAMYGGR